MAYAKRQAATSTDGPFPSQYDHLHADLLLLGDAELFERWATIAMLAEERLAPTGKTHADVIDGVAGALQRRYVTQRRLVAEGKPPVEIARADANAATERANAELEDHRAGPRPQ